MTWILLAYGIFLFILAFERKRIVAQSSFRVAWIFYALIPFSHAFFTLFRAGSLSHQRHLALVGIWENGVSWLLFGISLIALLNALVPVTPSSASSSGRLSDQIDQIEQDKTNSNQ